MKYEIFLDSILRIPALSYDNLESFLYNKNLLSERLNDPTIQEAIFLASPILYKELRKLSNNEKINHKKQDQLVFSLVRYISRMSTRATPFGLFAGCIMGQIGEKTDIKHVRSINRHTRLDMHFLCTLYDILVDIREVKEKIKFYPNTSLYSIGKTLRYIEYDIFNQTRQYKVSQVKNTHYLRKIIKKSKKGVKIRTLAECLVSDSVSIEDAIDFVSELINSKILIGELFQAVTGEDYLTRMIRLLDTLECKIAILDKLKDINNLLKELDVSSHRFDLYYKLFDVVDEMQIPYSPNSLIQVDLFNSASKVVLGKEIVNEIKSSIVFLNKITRPESNNILSQFKKEFYNRYEEKEVLLLEALDPDVGIGYPSINNFMDISPLVDDLSLPSFADQPFLSSDPFQSILNKKILESIIKNDKEVYLFDTDLESYSINWNDLPATIFALFEIIRSNGDDVLINIKSCGGSSGANLITRFAHAEDRVSQFVKNITSKEQEIISNSILAEIVYLPEARVGNTISRPHLRDYELLFLANSDLPNEKLINLSELKLSLRQNKLIIRSDRLNKEIIPMLTTAHNYYSSSIPVYRFLCDMQLQEGRKGFNYNWNRNEYPYIPRIRYKNTILYPASWILPQHEIKHLLRENKDEIILFEIGKWREKYRMPAKVMLSDGDNDLYVDWCNLLSIRSFFSIIKDRKILSFTEFLFEPENAILKDENGAYINECIVAFHKIK